MNTGPRALGASIAAFPAFYVLAVLYGAPLLSEFAETAILAAALSLFTAIPLVFAAEGDYNTLFRIALLNKTKDLNKKGRILQRSALGSLFGAWAGCVVIPLDWDRWWQKYPVPCLFGIVFGAVLGVVVASVEHHPTVRRWRRRFADRKLL